MMFAVFIVVCVVLLLLVTRAYGVSRYHEGRDDALRIYQQRLAEISDGIYREKRDAWDTGFRAGLKAQHDDHSAFELYFGKEKSMEEN